MINTDTVPGGGIFGEHGNTGGWHQSQTESDRHTWGGGGAGWRSPGQCQPGEKDAGVIGIQDEVAQPGRQLERKRQELNSEEFRHLRDESAK